MSDITWPDQVPVVLLDGPLAGQTVISPARAGMPPSHLLLYAVDPTRTVAGPDAPEDLSGWLLYADAGFDRVTKAWQFRSRGPADQKI